MYKLGVYKNIKDMSKEQIPQNLTLVSLSGSKKSIEKLQSICARLTGTHQKNLDYLKSVVSSPSAPAETIWTQDNIRLLTLQNYSFWKKKAQQNSMQGRAIMEFPPNIAELLLWFGLFRKAEIVAEKTV